MADIVHLITPPRQLAKPNLTCENTTGSRGSPILVDLAERHA
jgi:hypothetical protein